MEIQFTLLCILVHSVYRHYANETAVSLCDLNYKRCSRRLYFFEYEAGILF